VLVAQQYPVPKNFTTIPAITGQLPLININSIQTQVEGISLSQSMIHANKRKYNIFLNLQHMITLFGPRE